MTPISQLLAKFKLLVSKWKTITVSKFHVINNVAYQAVRGRDFLQSNDAIINFSKGTLKLDKTNSLKMTLGEEHTRPLAILTV